MNASPSHARSYRAARFPVSLLCVNRRRSLRPLCRLRLRGRGNGGGEGFIRGLNASGGGCQRRFTPAQSRPVDEGPKVHVGPQSSVTGGKEEEAGSDVRLPASRDGAIPAAATRGPRGCGLLADVTLGLFRSAP